ncbi:MAG: alpha/beta hydrolase [Planctomycetes bacterium]|nr:alpha/beta hydrolase [Planctomycetota bacterium]
MAAAPLILLPGLDGTGRLFDRVSPELARFAPVERVSYPMERGLGYAELQRVLEAKLPTADPYVLVAESFSGPIAIEHAAARPPLLRGLVLVATFAANPLPLPGSWLRPFAGLARPRMPKALTRLLLVGGDAPADLVEEVRATVATMDPAVIAQRIRQVLSVDRRARLASIAAPTLYLGGSRDRLVGARGWRQCAAGIQDLQRVFLDAPHLVLQRRPKESAAAIEAFLGRLDHE